jgi:hypothetical protein
MDNHKLQDSLTNTLSADPINPQSLETWNLPDHESQKGTRKVLATPAVHQQAEQASKKEILSQPHIPVRSKK